MEKDQDNNNGIREYLLGILDDPDLTTQIETRLLTEADFDDKLAEAEDTLIEEYLDGELLQAEIEKFESHFLAAPERKRHLRINQNLRKIAIGETAAVAVADKTPAAAASDKPGSWRGWFIPQPVFGFALTALILAGFGYGLLRIVFDRSVNVDAQIAELAIVYKGERPFTARITGFDHGNLTLTRGKEDDKEPKDLPPEERQIAARRELVTGKLEDAVVNDPTAEALYGRGKAYLATGKAQMALPFLEQAATKSPGDALIQSDLGSAYLGLSESASEKDKHGLLEKALQTSDKAIRINPKLREPYFNRALSLQLLGRTNEAKTAWQEYLRIDPDSAWSTEAKRELLKLEGIETSGKIPRKKSGTESGLDQFRGFFIWPDADYNLGHDRRRF